MKSNNLKIYRNNVYVNIMYTLFIILTSVYLVKVMNMEIAVFWLSLNKFLQQSTSFVKGKINRYVRQHNISITTQFYVVYGLTIIHMICNMVGIYLILNSNNQLGAWFIYASCLLHTILSIVGGSLIMNYNILVIGNKPKRLRHMQLMDCEIGGGICFLAGLIVVIYNLITDDWIYILYVGVMFYIIHIVLTPYIIKQARRLK